MKILVLAILFVIELGCASRHLDQSFRVLPAAPDYLLRSPDAVETPFPETLSRFTKTEIRDGAIDLRPQMELRIEQAYFRDDSRGYLGTNVARYQVRRRGLRLVEIQTKVEGHRVDQVISPAQRRARVYRYYYAVVFRREGDVRGSVLLGAASPSELDRLGNQLLANADSVCSSNAAHCTVFPANCTVSLHLTVLVNGAPRSISWGTTLAGVAGHSHAELWRLYAGRPTPVSLDPSDPKALRLPLLPGDRVKLD